MGFGTRPKELRKAAVIDLMRDLRGFGNPGGLLCQVRFISMVCQDVLHLTWLLFKYERLLVIFYFS
jgi:hypothetical protein